VFLSRVQDLETVVSKGAEAVGEGAGLLDDQVNRFGAADGDPAGVEVGQDLRLPGRDPSIWSADAFDVRHDVYPLRSSLGASR